MLVPAGKLGLISPKITKVLSGASEHADGHKFRYAVEVAWIRTGGARAVASLVGVLSPNPIRLSESRRPPQVEVDSAGVVLREFESAVAAGRHYKSSNTAIGAVCSGRLDECDGRLFRFKAHTHGVSDTERLPGALSRERESERVRERRLFRRRRGTTRASSAAAITTARPCCCATA